MIPRMNLSISPTKENSLLSLKKAFETDRLFSHFGTKFALWNWKLKIAAMRTGLAYTSAAFAKNTFVFISFRFFGFSRGQIKARTVKRIHSPLFVKRKLMAALNLNNHNSSYSENRCHF